MRKIVVGIFLALLSVWATVTIQAHELKIGLLCHDISPVWGKSKIEGGFDVNIEGTWGTSVVRPQVGFTINSQAQTNRIYGGYNLRCPIDFIDSITANISVGVCLAFNYRRALGSHVLFRVAGEIGYQFGPHSISLILDHSSNGKGIFKWKKVKDNQGIDTAGVRYGIRF